jgi:very-short-patch-repair endonuclease
MPDGDPLPIIPTSAPPDWWDRLKPLARQMRCKPTPAEELLWQRLRNRQIAGAKFRRQHVIERFIVDFYCSEAQLAIEIDGPIHDYTPVEDAVRQDFLESLGLRVMRFANDEVQAGIERVIRQIEEAVAS